MTGECTSNGQATLYAGAAGACDACGAAPVSEPGTVAYALGTTTVTHTATDESGNQASCTNTVTVVDTTAPTITCPADIVAECQSAGQALVDTGAASASDTCTAPTVVDPAPASYSLGASSAVTHVATDASGNSSQCTQAVAVVDTTAPVFNLPPGVATQTVVGSCAGAAIALPVAPTATDACDGATVTCTTVSGTSFGTNDVTCTARDASGNTSQATVHLIVLEPLSVAFDSPLAPGDNRISSGEIVPHRVRLLGCAGSDVTASAPVEVRFRERGTDSHARPSSQ